MKNKFALTKALNFLKKEFYDISKYLFKDKIVRETLFSSNTKYYKFLRYFNLFFSLIIFVPVIASFWSLNLPHFLGYLIFAFGVYVVWIFEWVTNSIIFEEIKTFTIIQIALHSFFGMFLEFYNKYEYYDDILHITGGIWLALIIFPIILSLELTFSRQKIPTLVWKVNLYTFFTSLSFGTIWEIFEFTSDQIFKNYPGYRMSQENSLFDTMTDLIYDAGGSILGIALFWYMLKKLNKNRDMYLLLERIGNALRNFIDKKND
ncbi:hypothetical protein OF820_10440 [Oceanotoga sp. DSM 15011]|uniref:Uncharacterized protein n=1 Tax=Oceanotoga teriensis TaxID=515440 RepID=A0AA45HJC1_9BACT|nr:MULTISPECIES: hypothetical protein [Oceanotoga]MDN5342517.1 hypothetical protein [Oceanotoga sp.]MDO7977483.1 hypothetical protein [Oceanotoga teriensis]PWJ95652.1 hypothetical protein C7380_10466 [Oceanotoga teriensis]UYO99486.1 hypothetical protein OF820_10440 [Oceanotoga sp. DSM 15011]